MFCKSDDIKETLNCQSKILNPIDNLPFYDGKIAIIRGYVRLRNVGKIDNRKSGMDRLGENSVKFYTMLCFSCVLRDKLILLLF